MVECLPIKTRALGSIPSTENCRQGSGLARGPPEGVLTTRDFDDDVTSHPHIIAEKMWSKGT